MGSEANLSGAPPRVLVIYDYFDPAVLAGGPINSLINMVNLLHDECEFSVCCSNRDLDGSELPVAPDQWIDHKGIAKVFYGRRRWGVFGCMSVLRSRRPDVIYLNGIYSLVGNIVPLLVGRLLVPEVRIVLAPRGMLQRSSLAVKAVKKQLYLRFFRLLATKRVDAWHVTGEQEAQELLESLPSVSRDRIRIVSNIPRMDIEVGSSERQPGVFRLLTIALISPMKNILPVIQALRSVKANVEYCLYGPVKDQAYWELCLDAAKTLPPNIKFTYQGAVDRNKVPDVLKKFDFFVQPSRSENFGHSLFEAMMAGLPVITSYNTPWNGLEKSHAGWNVRGDKPEEIADALSKAEALTPTEYRDWSRGARNLAEGYLEHSHLWEKYTALFSETL